MKAVGAAALAAALGLAACAASLPAKPKAYPVTISGSPYVLSQITAGTWTAIPADAGPSQVGSISLAHRAGLLKAIESASGCSVTDSDYSRQGMQLDAQVDCASRLKY